ncbi:hypothetical protein [Sphingomonas sp.]|uniref:hypothetical protein n=1 Tax=Sphingomonas sp. TaxID=28214 RepID=UPI0031D1D569
MKRLIGLSAIAALALPTGAMAQRGWETIGFRTVGAGSDRDTIAVRGNERHRQIRICSINRPIGLQDVRVRFNNGARQDIRTRQVLRGGTCTAAKDLRGRGRNLRTVDITYTKLQRGVLPPLVRIQAR